MVQRHLLLKYLNRGIEIETGHGTLYKGIITDLDDWGVHFIPEDKKLRPVIISWADIRKVILIEEASASGNVKKSPAKKRRSLFDEGF
ncbi:MAG: hypothetical protein OIN89_07330 [Candidatus Methanoperedens sp.]|jgi:hypothetical protein|nr:hypothetical protein [Candidatus Methanoperedens sp.]PKL53565.1 MAG: hypothetical protein CVV36_06365 [Candidatus Methanoperedenaceae archaeon HGW-Methanoperedenaceae-1]